METTKVKRLWGHDFRVVPGGLAEDDVALFVERLMRKYQASLERSDHIEPLHRLARNSVEEAERMAAEIKERAHKESDRLSGEIVAGAEHQAREIIERANIAAHALEEKARRNARRKIAELEESLMTMRKWADEEFQWLKEQQERTRLFHSTFEGLLSLMASGIELDEPDIGCMGEPAASQGQSRRLIGPGSADGRPKIDESHFAGRAFADHKRDPAAAFEGDDGLGSPPFGASRAEDRPRD